jgi:hypothetical protein
VFSNQEMNAGFHDAEFSAEKLASGIYFYRLTIAETDVNGVNGKKYTLADRMLLLK